MDDIKNSQRIKNGQRINYNGVYGTVIGKRSTRNQRLVLAQMDNGFTLKLQADSLSVIEQPVAVMEAEEIRKAS
jgi:hypothetical protein